MLLLFLCLLLLPRYSGVQIPTLEETISVVKELDLVLFLEVKALSQNVRHVNKYSSSYYNKPLKLLSLNIIINVYFFFLPTYADNSSIAENV